MSHLNFPSIAQKQIDIIYGMPSNKNTLGVFGQLQDIRNTLRVFQAILKSGALTVRHSHTIKRYN